jgi:hypothetical protein
MQDMIAMEVLIARTMNLPQEARRKFATQWNPVTVRDAQNRWPFMNWEVYLQDLAMDMPDIQKRFQDADFQLICKSPRYFDGFSKAIEKKNISQRTLQNYLMYRLVASQSGFINPLKTKVTNSKTKTMLLRYISGQILISFCLRMRKSSTEQWVRPVMLTNGRKLCAQKCMRKNRYKKFRLEQNKMMAGHLYHKKAFLTIAKESIVQNACENVQFFPNTVYRLNI